ncbi:MAG: thioredoxin family protein [Gammaproteobacteria bacterium]|nr:thioredoxin family protein [Gammaproteobacteria bacterium]
MPAIKTLTQFDFYAEIEETRGLGLVYFSAHACSSCKHLTHVLSQLAEDQPDLSIFKVDAQQDTALIKEYDVFHLPALFLFKEGQYHAELECESNAASILNCINLASQQAAEEAP